VRTHSSDLVILGGGSGGYACALRAAQLGQSVVLIEQGKLGGTCLHQGCIPTKALLHAAEVADGARESAKFGVLNDFRGIDMPKVAAYKNGVVDKLFTGLQGLINSRGIKTVTARGTFVGPRSVDADGTRYTGGNVVLATGSRAKTPEGLKVADRVVTSDEALALDWVPSRAIVLGGGVIGVEFASLWRSFGSEVVLVEALPRLLPTEDEFASRLLERAFRRRGITVKTGVTLTDVTTTSNAVSAVLSSGDELSADLLLVAVGRGPNTDVHGFAESGVALDQRGFVVTDEDLRTSLPGVYAVGDVVAGLQLAHRGFQQGIFVAEHLAGLQPRKINETGIPRVAYCEPEVASVGLTENAAREKFGNVQTHTYDLGGNGKSQILQTQGAIKVVKAHEEGRPGPIVGVHLVGSRVGELIGEAQLLYNWEANPGDVTPLLHAHPTQNEALGEALLALAGKPLHAHH
jgi:dihydrolipoamide dehydrogenase